jgi:CubicO group peptidase (beta-lactamase class C family)
MVWTNQPVILLSLSVVLLAPTAAHAEVDPQAADFQATDAYVSSQMEAMHIPGVALGIVQGDKLSTSRGLV